MRVNMSLSTVTMFLIEQSLYFWVLSFHENYHYLINWKDSNNQ